MVNAVVTGCVNVHFKDEKICFLCSMRDETEDCLHYLRIQNRLILGRGI